METITITKAGIADAEEILAVQKLAYISEAEIWNDYTIPPLMETLKEIEKDFAEYIILKACDGRKIIGSVRAKKLENGSCYLGRLSVHPEYQNRGLGRKLALAVEELFPTCGRVELFTGEKSVKNRYLYEKLGYRITGKQAMNNKVTIVNMVKDLKKKETEHE